MSLADDLVERSLNKRQAAYTIEVRQIIDATYRVIAKTGSFDPPVRSILREAKLSSPAFYRHFRSKDELLLVMLDEGRRKLVGYLAHRIDAATSAGERVAEWVRGVLAQAGDPTAARLTRPFVTEVERLHEQFPEEQRASEQLLLRQLADLLDDGRSPHHRRRRQPGRRPGHRPADHLVPALRLVRLDRLLQARRGDRHRPAGRRGRRRQHLHRLGAGQNRGAPVGRLPVLASVPHRPHGRGWLREDRPDRRPAGRRGPARGVHPHR